MLDGEAPGGLEIEMVGVEAEVHDGEQDDEAAGNVGVELHENGEGGDNDDKEFFQKEDEPREANVMEFGCPGEFTHFMGGKRKDDISEVRDVRPTSCTPSGRETERASGKRTCPLCDRKASSQDPPAFADGLRARRLDRANVELPAQAPLFPSQKIRWRAKTSMLWRESPRICFLR